MLSKRPMLPYTGGPPASPYLRVSGSTLYAVQYADAGQAHNADVSDPGPWASRIVGFGIARGVQVGGELRIPLSEIGGSPGLGSTLFVGAGKATTVSPTTEGHGVRIVGEVVAVSGDWATVAVRSYPLTVVLDKDLTT